MREENVERRGDGSHESVERAESVEDVIADVMGEESKHSVDAREAVATQFYVMEVVTAHASHEASRGDVELLLSSEEYVKGEIREFSHHPDTPEKVTRIVSQALACPPMPHVLALEAWVSETGVAEYLEWSDNE